MTRAACLTPDGVIVGTYDEVIEVASISPIHTVCHAELGVELWSRDLHYEIAAVRRDTAAVYDELRELCEANARRREQREQREASMRKPWWKR